MGDEHRYMVGLLMRLHRVWFAEHDKKNIE